MVSSKDLFYSYIAQTSPSPLELEITKASGVYLFGKNGEKYLDLISGISVSNVGHVHSKVVKAVQDQAATYMHLMVYGEYVQSPQVKLAEKITSLLPDSLNNVYFVNSGSEANEGAMKVAKKYTGRKKIIYCKNAYHGSTQGALSIIGDDSFKEPFEPLLPETYSISYNDFDDINVIDNETAAIVIECVQAEAGIIEPSSGYLESVRKRCNEVGAMLIFDEVQTGFGRTGKMWGWEHTNVVPDIMTVAKGMGGGMPIGAFISSKEIMTTLTHHPVLGHITTFGGHPVSCAASLACIEVIEEEDLIKNISDRSLLFKSLLSHSEVLDVRGVGFLLCVEFSDAEFNFEVIKKCIEKGVITDWFLFNDKCLRIAPPLTITEEQIRFSCTAINEAIEEVSKERNSVKSNE